WGPAVDMLLAQEEVTDIYNAEGSPGVNLSWPLLDYQNSVVDGVGGMGSGVGQGIHVRYDAFGNDLYVDGDGNPTDGNAFQSIGWTGKFHDPMSETSSLQWNGQRVYNATLATWMTQDPIGFAGDPSNLTRYVGNSPTNYVDPTGLQRPGEERIDKILRASN